MPAVGDPALDRFARIVRDALAVPTALVSLVSRHEQVLPGAVGLPEPWQTTRSTPLTHSVCQHVVQHGEPLVLTDVRDRPDLIDAAAAADLRMVAYAGYPLVDAHGTVLGSLCAIDPRPRTWSSRELDLLSGLAEACSTDLQLRLERAAADTHRSRLELAISASAVGTFDWDLSGDGMHWDPPLVSMFGYTAEDFEPTTASFYRRLHPDDAERVTQAITTAIDTRGEFAAEYRIVLPDGATRWVQGRGRVIGEPTGRATRFIGAAYDTTDVHDGEARVGRLLAAMPSGFLSLDGQWRFTVVNPAAEKLLGQSIDQLAGRTIWEAYPDTVGNEFEHAYRTAVRTQQPQTIHAYYPAPLDAWYDVLCWPTPEGLSLFFTDVTDRTRSDRQARAAAERLAVQARVADLLTGSTDLADVLTTLPQLLAPAVADACVVTVLGPDGRARDHAYWHGDPAARVHLAGYATTRLVELSGSTPFGRTISDGQRRHLTAEQTAAVVMHPDARMHLDALGPVRASILPLQAQGRVLGALTLLSSADRPRDAELESVTEDIADRVAAAMETDRLTRARSQLAEALQRSLLTAPPEPDHAEVVVRYLPAGEAARVGGDWYDAFLQPNGCTMIVIGDVVGHDTEAAAAMGALRGLLRGIATYSDAGPAEVLRGLDTSMQVLEVDTLATAAVARFEQTPDEVERGVTRMVWANAGHPPPVVLHPDGTFQVLAPWKGELLLGVDPTTIRHDQVTLLERGATVLLFTDGLIERRRADLDDGLTRLTDALTALPGTTLDELCDGIIDRLVAGHPEDDVALVAVRLHRQDRPRPPEAGPPHVPPGVPEPEHPAQ
ncbi:SpoIIE family protein phosphatase [Klenkia sp. PcliD-1-E]|uniref:SpoIIE family protein phosphatase n=1 Tax=Klenkia sp. PcliD-1-E TaxID=2954492 RepID=UPI002098281C|nr:SpoIIE family protein phosphatase [Klenkia sp. PcliD-1-E]MCO7220071.1 SpoIIE family protein phosphatase [Klenkia sp. PcliD-1-E]